MNDERRAEERQEVNLEVGFQEDLPRRVDHQYELDRLFREWHSSPTPFAAVQKGDAIIALLMQWINYDHNFTVEDRREARDLRDKARTTVKTKVELRAKGKHDEHYFACYDGVPMYLRGSEFRDGMSHIREEANIVKKDAQVDAISGLMGICYRRGLLKLDYSVGRTVRDAIEEGMR